MWTCVLCPSSTKAKSNCQRSAAHQAASGSEKTEPDYPGRVFAEPDRDYAEVMAEFVATSLAAPAEAEVEPLDSLKAQKQALRQEQHQLRDSRRQLRQHRHQEDAAWKQLQQDHRQQPNPAWKTLRQQRRQALLKRDQEDERWRQQRLELRQRASQLPLVIAWIAKYLACSTATFFMAANRVVLNTIVDQGSPSTGSSHRPR